MKNNQYDVKLDRNIIVGIAAFAVFCICGIASVSGGIAKSLLFTVLFLTAGLITFTVVSAFFSKAFSQQPDWFMLLPFSLLCAVSRFVLGWGMITPFFIVGMLGVLAGGFHQLKKLEKNIAVDVSLFAVSVFAALLFPIICICGGLY